MSSSNFVRFVNEEGAIVYGVLPSSETKGRLEGKSVAVVSGDPFAGFSTTENKATIVKVGRVVYYKITC